MKIVIKSLRNEYVVVFTQCSLYGIFIMRSINPVRVDFIGEMEAQPPYPAIMRLPPLSRVLLRSIKYRERKCLYPVNESEKRRTPKSKCSLCAGASAAK